MPTIDPTYEKLTAAQRLARGTDAVGLPLNDAQKAFQQKMADMESGKISPAQAQAMRDASMAKTLQSSTSINNYGANTPQDIAAQKAMNEKYNLAPGTGLSGEGGLAKQVQPIIAQRNAPTVATPAQPLMSKGGNTPTFSSPNTQNSQKTMEDIAYKKLGNQTLNEDENRFLIRQNLQSYQAQKSPAQDFSQPKVGDTAGGYYRAPSNPNGSLKVPLPSQYQTEEQFAQSNPEAYDMWASQNGHYYSQDGVNYYPGKPGEVNFSVDQYMNATPEDQLKMKQQAFAGMSQKQQDLINGAFDQLIGKNTEKYNTTKSTLETDNASKLADFTKNQEAAAADATKTITQQGNEEQQNIKEMQSFSGFGRSTKTMEIMQRSSENTKARIADIERQKGQAIGQFQASLIDKMQNRLDQISSQGDQLQTAKMQKSLDLTTELMKQDPSNPDNMFKLAEDLRKNKIEQSKLDLQERKQIHDEAMGNFKFMVENYGSNFTHNLSPEDLTNLSSNTGIAVGTLTHLGKTMSEQKDDWDKLKYVDSQQFDLKKMGLQWNQDLQKLAQQQGFDIQKMQAGQQWDVQKMLLGKQIDLAPFRNLGYSTYQDNASGNTGSAFSYDTPVPHPSANTVVNEVNPKLAQAYPQGYKFSQNDASGGLGGQCAWFGEQLVNFFNGKGVTVGNTLADKKASVAKFVKQGLAYMPGQEDPQVGQSIITNDSKANGHYAVINAKTPDGKLVLTESNFSGPLTVSNSRIVDPNDPSIIGFLKTVPKKEFSIGGTIGKALGDLAGSGQFGVPAQFLSKLPELFGKVVKNQSEAEQATKSAATQAKQQELYKQGKVDEQGQSLTPFRQSVRAGTSKLTDAQEMQLAGADPQAFQSYQQDKMFGTQNGGGSGKEPTQFQSQAAGYAVSAQQGENVINEISQKNGDKVAGLNNFISRTQDAPGPAQDQLDKIKDPDGRRLANAELYFIEQILRPRSGAAISMKEYDSYGRQYMPRPGDSAQDLKDKSQRRQVAINALLYGAGKGGQKFFEQSGFQLPEMFQGAGGGGNSGGDQADQFGNFLMQ